LGHKNPQARWLHSACVIAGKMVVFGGVNPDSVILGDVWMFDPVDESWLMAQVDGVPILPREGHSAVAVGTSMIVFGGISYAYAPFDDVWTYVSASNKWVRNQPEGQKPAPRWMHSAALHTAKSGQRSMYVFGGITHQYVPLNDLWTLNVESMEWSQPTTSGVAPFPRMLHSATLFDNTMFIHAGGANNLLLEDLWTFDTDSNEWAEKILPYNTPFARMGGQMAAIKPPTNPSPYADDRPKWTPGDTSIPDPKTQQRPELRTRKEYSTNSWLLIFGGARNAGRP